MGLTLDERFYLLLHKKIMEKKGSTKRRAKKYYKDQYQKTGIIPKPLLLAEKGIMEGRKCSGRPRSLTAPAVVERERQLPGVRVQARTRRSYLFGSLFSHVIGFVGEVGQADLDTTGDWSGYHLGDAKGKQGLEAAMESVLRGESGVNLEEVNASGRIVGRETVWLREVVPGEDVVLSISVPLQQVMADALGDRPGLPAQAVQRRRRPLRGREIGRASCRERV